MQRPISDVYWILCDGGVIIVTAQSVSAIIISPNSFVSQLAC